MVSNKQEILLILNYVGPQLSIKPAVQGFTSALPFFLSVACTDAYSTGQSAWQRLQGNGHAERLEQGTQMGAIELPASNGARGDLPPHLDGAACTHHAARLEKVQTAPVPVQAAEFQQPARD